MMNFQLWLVVMLFIVITSKTSSGLPANGDGSRCNNVSCSPPLPGANCRPSYEREDGCCPVWYCTASNGAQSVIYGKSTSSQSSDGNSYSSSWSSSSGNGGGGVQQTSWSSSSGNGGGLGVPQIRLPNLFGGLFGG